MAPLRTQVRLPLAVDDELLSNDLCEQPENQFSRISFFIQTLKLYDILGEILSIFYDSSGIRCAEKSKPEDYYQSLLRLDRILLDFETGLPPVLRLHFVDENNQPLARDPIFTRQANVLHAR